VSNSDDELTHDLECLRLASDLMQLFRNTQSAELQDHCVQMAAYWANRTDRGPAEAPENPDDLDV